MIDAGGGYASDWHHALALPVNLPNGLYSGVLEAAVARDQGKVKAEGCCRDDSVGHVGDKMAGNLLKQVRHVGI